VTAVREAFPAAVLTVDANAAYTLADAPALEALDRFGLGYIEQPLAEDDLHDHAALAARIATPVCLDESITSAARAGRAIAAGACAVINIKQGRLGGLEEARRVHDVCGAAGVPVWCGGMLETGLGRAANLALAAMPNFTLPGDTSASRRYFHEDLTTPFEMSRDGTIGVPDGPGLGVEPIPEVLQRLAVRREKVAV
jgi:O-succinylbenzoate synthase